MIIDFATLTGGCAATNRNRSRCRCSHRQVAVAAAAAVAMGSKAMNLLSDIECKRHMTVLQKLHRGEVSANTNYIGVYPLNIAVELSDPDAVAMLLKYGADPLRKPNPVQGASLPPADALELARRQVDNPKTAKATAKLAAARLVVELLNDPKLALAHYEELEARLLEINTNEVIAMRRFFLGFLAVGAVALVSYYFFFQTLSGVEEL